MIFWRKCKDIALSIFIIHPTNLLVYIIHNTFWAAIILDNGRVFESLYKNSTSKYEPIMKNKLVGLQKSPLVENLAAKFSCDFKVPVFEADCNYKIPALVPIITINVCLIIFSLMPKSSLKYWKWALDKAFLTFVMYLVITPVSSLHFLFNIFFLV